MFPRVLYCKLILLTSFHTDLSTLLKNARNGSSFNVGDEYIYPVSERFYVLKPVYF